MEPRVDSRCAWITLSALALYFTLQFLLRICLSPGAELDEAEQLVLTQQFSWVYGSQPPLYTWLQILIFQFTGPGIVGLALLKNLLLLFTYSGTFFFTRSITGSARKGLASALLLFLIPQVVWESQRDLTHSILVTSMGIATLLSLRALWARPSTLRYILFGIVSGFGFLSKYNYALFWVALLIGIAATPQIRKKLLHPKLLWTILAAVLVVLPHGWAALDQIALVTLDAHKFHQVSQPSFSAILHGFKNLIIAVLSYLGPLLAVGAGIFFVRKHPRNDPAPKTWLKLFCIVAIAAILLCGALILFAGVTEFKDRWMQPLLFFIPVLLILRLGDPLPLRFLKVLAGVSLFIGMLVLGLTAGRTFVAAKSRLNIPFADFAEKIRNQGPPPQVIVAEDHFYAGNFRLQFPDSTILSPRTPLLSLPENPTILLVWKDNLLPGPPQKLDQWIEQNLSTTAPAAPPITLRKLRRFSEKKTDAIGMQRLLLQEAPSPK
ncbi:ArnT family glycosyltransferase [Puniceicoccus vermicola]|uniref:ArnT family glycosyltransferase n=1 Tax=Puniceicoccus vermicola TaxID=388746 RepID=UPI001C8C8BAD|nr:glycosyltransferase family 39 protein [Puniceicoccus vermicola]